MRLSLIPLVFCASTAWADCPPVADRQSELDALVAEANAAPNEAAGRAASGQMWEIWLDAPDEAAQALLDEGLVATRVSDYSRAISVYDRLIAYCPDYAEGYNQRAFAYFLSGSFERAAADLGDALAREPRHVGALTGLGRTLLQLGREEEAQIWFKKAVALNPWLSERQFIKDPSQEL
ncbi:MAG: tetratricopeptide repeat protein [Pseudomonadota bacterium]